MRELFGAVAVGLLLLVIGIGTGTEWVFYAGAFILPLALLWGGLFKSEQNTPVRVALLAVAGLLIAVTMQLFGAISFPW